MFAIIETSASGSRPVISFVSEEKAAVNIAQTRSYDLLHGAAVEVHEVVPGPLGIPLVTFRGRLLHLRHGGLSIQAN